MNRDHRLTALEQRVQRAGGHWDKDDERRKVRALPLAQLIAALRECAAELGKPLSARDEEMIAALQRLDPSSCREPRAAPPQGGA